MSKYHIALIVALIGVLGAFLTPLLTDPPGVQTSYSYAPSGSRAFRELAAEFNGSVNTWRSVPAQLRGNGNTLLMLEPIPGLLALQDRYRQDLLNWVAAGNHLLMVPATYQASVETLMKQRIEINLPLGTSSEGVQSLFKDTGFRISMSSRPGLDALEGKTLEQQQELHLQFADTSATFEVYGTPCRTFLEYDPRLKVEARLGEQVVMLGADWGDGGLHVLTMPQLFRNGSLAMGDHAGAAMAVLHSLHPDSNGRLLIDEFFHGLPAMSGVLDLIIRPPFHLFALQLLLFTALVLWALLPRPVPIRAQLHPSRRSKAEHLDAMGRLLANGTESALVLERISVGLVEDLRSKFHLHTEQSAQGMASYLRRIDPVAATEYDALMKRRRELGALKSVPEKSLLEWGRQMAKFRVSILGHRPSVASKSRYLPSSNSKQNSSS